MSTASRLITYPFTYRIPDLGVYLRDQLVDDQHYISAIPELLVEVLSPANRKGSLAELIEDYEHLRAPEVWFLELEERRIRRRLFAGGKLVEAGVFTTGSLAPRFSPDAAVDLRRTVVRRLYSTVTLLARFRG